MPFYLTDTLGRFRSRIRFLAKRLLSSSNNAYITCRGKKDGIGAQTQAVLSTLLFAHDMGIRYVHTPFVSIEHGSKDDAGWAQQWEEFFSFGLDEIALSNVRDLGVRCIKLTDCRNVGGAKDALFVIPHCHAYADLFPNRYRALRASLSRKYHHSPKNIYASHRSDGVLNVAVHIRRGDVSSEGEFSDRYTHNQLILSVLRRVNRLLEGMGTRVRYNIYSQGNVEEFSFLAELPVAFYLNHCLFTTFHNMVEADILFMSKSSLSYSIAVFSQGVKIYEPFWHPPLKDWIVSNPRGGFDESKFRRQVRAMVPDRQKA
jgi:hypothetical protein